LEENDVRLFGKSADPDEPSAAETGLEIDMEAERA
jgi:hypothetical protein